MGDCYRCSHTCTADDPCPCCRPVFSSSSSVVTIDNEIAVVPKVVAAMTPEERKAFVNFYNVGPSAERNPE